MSSCREVCTTGEREHRQHESTESEGQAADAEIDHKQVQLDLHIAFAKAEFVLKSHLQACLPHPGCVQAGSLGAEQLHLLCQISCFCFLALSAKSGRRSTEPSEICNHHRTKVSLSM